jgi:type II secretory pathway pseudopilin PulG
MQLMRRVNSRGDTIVEVLIAIGIAAFAIGTSYAVASKSLQQAISARERNQAINVLENQLNALKFREQQTDAATFTSKFSTPVTHFCLDETATDPTVTSSWYPKPNNGAVTADTPLQPGTAPISYAAACQKDTDYYVDITTLNRGGRVPTVYKINVRWERIGGGPVNEASVYYRF